MAWDRQRGIETVPVSKKKVAVVVKLHAVERRCGYGQRGCSEDGDANGFHWQ